MDIVSVDTTHNVRLDYAKANVGDRMVATLIDGVVSVAYMIAVIFLMVKLNDMTSFETNETGYIIFIMFLAIPYVFYHLLFETFMNGQTPGKKVMKIKVLRLDGLEANFGAYALRWLFRMLEISAMPVIAIIAIAASKDSQRLGDMVAGTTVVKLSRKVNLNETLYKDFEEDYQIQYTQVSLLKQEHISLINEVLIAYRKDGSYDMVVSMADKIKQMLNITVKQKPMDFLETILKDYSHLEEKPYYSQKDRF